MIDKFKSTGGLDAANQKLVNVADGDQAQDGVNIRVLDKKNTVQSHSTSRTYELGFIVEYNGQLWKCTTPVAVAGVFNSTNWTALAGRENWIRLTANYTAGVMDSLYVDAASAITVTLPPTPKSGDYVTIFDGAGLASTRPITVARNGTTINGSAADVILNEDDIRCIFIYLGGTWKTLYAKQNRVKFAGSSAFTALSNLEYLIDVSSNFTVTLPVAPKVGDRIRLVDYNSGLGVNTITVNGNGKQINGSANYLFTLKKGDLGLSYNGTQWIAILEGGTPLQADQNLADVPDKPAARTALGLGNMAIQTVGTGASEFRTNAVNDTTYQAKDATLTALAALVTAANKLIYATGIDTFAQTDLTAQARTFLAAATQATQRSSMGLGSAATMNMGTALGELMQVGAFGLGSFTQLTNTPDLVTVTGLYTVPMAATGAPNAALNSVMLHYEIASAIEVGAVQFAIDTNTVLYSRVRSGASTWGAWASIAPASSLGTAAFQDIGTDPGDVMGVGAFGLGTNSVPSVSNLDTTLISGIYSFGLTPTGTPGFSYGTLVVSGRTVNETTQLAIGVTVDEMKFRRRVSGVWSNWVSLITSDDIGTAAAKNFGTAAGNLMEVGAFGLGTNGTHGNTSADVDTLTQAGWYWVNAAGPNKPVGGSGCLFVNAAPNLTTVSQWFYEAVSTATTTVWFRTKNFSDSTWKPWVELYHSGNVENQAWITPTFQNSWVEWNSATYPVGYRKILGHVQLRGLISGGTGNSVVFTLPVGYRPARQAFVPIKVGASTTNAFGCISIDVDGLVRLTQSADITNWQALDGVWIPLT